MTENRLHNHLDEGDMKELYDNTEELWKARIVSLLETAAWLAETHNCKLGETHGGEIGIFIKNADDKK